MKFFLMRILPVFLLFATFHSADCDGQTGKSAGKYGKGIIIKSGIRKSPSVSKQPKVKEPKAVVRAKKKQEKNEKKLKKENDKAVAAAKSRHFSIQAASVQERMKQNEKDAAYREKTRKKTIKKASRPVARRYKK